jgi:hypothetical protein
VSLGPGGTPFLYTFKTPCHLNPIMGEYINCNPLGWKSTATARAGRPWTAHTVCQRDV